jgi:hypothetical protein
MDRNRLMWWGLGVIGLGLSAWVTYLFVLGPLPPRFKQDWTAEAKVQLVRLCELEKTYFGKHGRYNDTLSRIGYYQDKTDGGEYWLQVDAHDSTNFLAHAYARQDRDEDGEQSVWEINKDCVPRMLSED